MIDFRISRRAALAGMAALPFAGSARAETIGAIRKLDPGLDAVLDWNTPIEVIATGIQWAEGPAWVKDGNYLVFSDPPANIAYRWSAKDGKSIFMKPSGLAGPIPLGVREAGSNGMMVDATGRLIMADSGTRAVAAVDLKTRAKTILADRYDGKRFNSCNDVAIADNGTIYFTDPPYGFTDGDASPLKEMPWNGVYRIDPEGQVQLVDKLTRPNGIGVSPDQQTLYVSISDEKRPVILAYPLDIEGGASDAPKVFHDFSEGVAKKLYGLPDGMKVARSGHLFASGPGGMHVFAADGRLLGVIDTGKACANCAFGEDGKSLFLTSSDMVARVRLKMSGW